MKTAFTATIEAADGGGDWGICPEIPGWNGQEETVEVARKSLWETGEMLKQAGEKVW